MPLQPTANAMTRRRPTFSVKNAERTGPPAALTYRFEVAADLSFATLAASGTVAEGSGQTAFTPPADLPSGATYFWRARASAAELAVTSAYSSASSFATIAPDNGNYRYDLVIGYPTDCRSQRGFESLQQTRFDDNLSVDNDMLRFTVWDGNLTVNIARAGTQLSGTIGGLSQPYLRESSGQTFEVWRTFFDHMGVNGFTLPPPATLSGTSDSKGRLSGTFDGVVESYLSYETWSCAARGFTWSLMPH